MAEEQGKTVKMPFFPKQKRKIVLHDWAPKLNAQDEKRLLLQIRMPIEGQPLPGLPEFLSEAYQAMEKQPRVDYQHFEQEIEGVTLDFYDHDKAKEHNQFITGCTLRNFALERMKSDKETLITLTFNTTIPRTKKILSWADDYHRKTMWASFSEGQMVIPPPDAQMKLGEAEEEEEEDEDSGRRRRVEEMDDADIASLERGKGKGRGAKKVH